MNLFLKLVELRSRVEGFYKDTKSFGYSYVSGAQILDKINPIMNELKLLFLPKKAIHRGWTKHEYINKKKEEMLDFIVEGELDYVWINAENPEETWLIEWEYYGAQNDISKAFGSALTYSERYLLLKSLGLPTDEEDPDSRDTNGNKAKNKPQSNPQAYQSTVPEQPIKEDIDALVKTNNNNRYKTILQTVAVSINNSEMSVEAKKEMAKRIINDYITKTLHLSFKNFEFVNREKTKLIDTNVEVLVGETIDKCVSLANQELDLFNSTQEEAI